MFIYLVAVVATLFIIFGLLHARCLNDWLRSSIRYSRILYNERIRNSEIEERLNNENLQTVSTLSIPLIITDEVKDFIDFMTQRTAYNTKERLSNALMGEVEGKSRNLNQPRYSLEDVLSGERDKDLGLPTTRTLQLGTAKDDTIKTSKQEGKENIFESLQSSMEKKTHPHCQLNQIYNLILKETFKDNTAKQKVLEDENSKLKESLPINLVEQVPSSSEKKIECENMNSIAKSDD
ncbi:uncharacterized protein LOC143146746 [Ptiloglossa arizonensis]|uniref:uncharacterized protein LOC143146746 n=1 Tax=Ptiloglossa arizonensis TaxID=3350558 RepID=UPI003FA07182